MTANWYARSTAATLARLDVAAYRAVDLPAQPELRCATEASRGGMQINRMGYAQGLP